MLSSSASLQGSGQANFRNPTAQPSERSRVGASKLPEPESPAQLALWGRGTQTSGTRFQGLSFYPEVPPNAPGSDALVPGNGPGLPRRCKEGSAVMDLEEAVRESRAPGWATQEERERGAEEGATD